MGRLAKNDCRVSENYPHVEPKPLRNCKKSDTSQRDGTKPLRACVPGSVPAMFAETLAVPDPCCGAQE